MASEALDKLREQYKKQDNSGSNRPNNYYPFWNMKNDENAVVRFLPDSNPDNPLGFMVEKLMHNLIINGEKKNVPCLKMYDEDCPICKVSSAYYKAEDKVNGKKFWRKKQHIAQALVIDDPLPADKETKENHEGQVRFLALGYQLFEVIKATFEGGELDEVPYAYENGVNFIIKKTEQGEYSTYATASKFSRKDSSLTEDEIAMVSDHMVDLSTLLPANPGVEKVEAMLEAALTGSEYKDGKSGGTSTPAAKAETPTAKAETPATETKTESASSDDAAGDDDADDLLAQIRQRRAAKASG